MLWRKTNKGDERAIALSRRHYNAYAYSCTKVRSMGKPGRSLVLVLPDYTAVWQSIWQRTEYIDRGYLVNVWECATFRNESTYKSSILIKQAVAATLAEWLAVPSDGFMTFVNPRKVNSKQPGTVFTMAGWVHYGTTPKGLLVLQLPTSRFPVGIDAPHLYNKQPDLQPLLLPELA